MNAADVEYYARKEQDARDDRESDRAEQMQQEDETPVCHCKHPNGKPFNVLLDVDAGRINNVVCANCELRCVLWDDLELLESEGIPARLTVTVETYSNPIVGTETNVYLVLDAQPYEEDL
jgi:hypothetical protein